jgi:hypothetical protein
MQPNTPKNNKSLMLVGITVLALVVALFFYFNRDRSLDTDLLESAPAGLIAIDQDLLATLKELQAIKLNENIFVDRIFLGLVDFSRPIVPQPYGRPNPFAPFSQEELRIGNLSTSTVSLPGMGR